MSTAERVQQDLDYVSSTVRNSEAARGTPSIYFLWAAITLVGFALVDFLPAWAGQYWFVTGIGGGILSWWLGRRDALHRGINDKALGQRYALHYTITGFAFILVLLPMAIAHVSPHVVVPNFLLVAGLMYALAGVHLERPLLWLGLLMLAAYVVLIVAQPPHLWTITGVLIAAGLLWAGIVARRPHTATDAA